MSDASTARWNVYHEFIHQTSPAKNKFFVIAYVRPEFCLGLLINSEINSFARARPKHVECMVPVSPAACPFLSHPSYVDCTEAFTFPHASLINLHGTLTQFDVERVLNGVRACTIIRRGHQDAILNDP